MAVAMHFAMLSALPRVQASGGPELSPSEVSVAIVEPEEPQEPEEPIGEEALEAEEPQQIPPTPKPRAPKPPKEPPTPDEPPAAAEETPVSFDNIVLTNEGNEPTSWAVNPGSGQDREGPIGNPNAAVTGRSRDGVAGGVIGGTGTGLVDVGDLSRQPVPPSLRRKLERLYPEKARAEGTEGEAVVRLQVNSNGKTSRLRLVSENPQGYEFGQACLRALRNERWKPPLDQEGRTVATRVTYRCGFKVRY